MAGRGGEEEEMTMQRRVGVEKEEEEEEEEGEEGREGRMGRGEEGTAGVAGWRIGTARRSWRSMFSSGKR